MKLTIEDLIDRLGTMPAEDISEAGRHVRDEHRSAAAEVAWWSATVRVERLVRRRRTGSAAATAAAAAGRAVKHAAGSGGLSLDDPDVIATARAASDAARSLVAGEHAAAETAYFLDRLGAALASPVRVLAAA